MLIFGYYLFGLIGGIVAISPVIFIIITKNFWWLLGFIPSLLVARGFYVLSGYCKYHKIKKETGLTLDQLRQIDPRG